jgi:NADH-quinone oxidoreductase subunit J
MFILIFILLTYIILQASFLVILSINPIYSIFNLILVFIGITFILLIFNIDFIAMLFLIIYVGAISVLFLFIIMMLNLKIVNIKKYYSYYLILGFFIGIIFFFEILIILIPIPILHIFSSVLSLKQFSNDFYLDIVSINNIENISFTLYNDYMYLFIISGLILLVAMIGAIVLTNKNSEMLKKQNFYNQTNQNIILKLIN